MYKLARYIENEFDRNSLYFAQAETSMLASIDFIDFVLKDKNLVQLTPEERLYVKQIRKSYVELRSLSSKMIKEIQKYKEAFCQLFADE